MKCACLAPQLTLQWFFGTRDHRPVMRLEQVICNGCGTRYKFDDTSAMHAVLLLSGDRTAIELQLVADLREPS